MLTIVVAALVVIAIAGFAFMLGGPLVALILAVIAVVAAVVWLVGLGTSRQTPGDVARRADENELLGPGGPDDPNR